MKRLPRHATGRTPYQRQLNTTFLSAVNRGTNPDTISRLMAHGVTPFATDGDMNNALHLTLAAGHIHLVDTLLGFGVRPDQRNSDGETPAAVAEAKGYRDVAATLRAREDAIPGQQPAFCDWIKPHSRQATLDF